MRLSVLSILPLAMASPAVQRRAQPAPVLVSSNKDDLIAGQYIVKLKDGSSVHALETATAAAGDNANYVYRNLFRGFSTRLDEHALETLRQNPDVDYIEQDSVARIQFFVDQPDATWGLSRISHKVWHKDYHLGYDYASPAGQGTCAYVIDTGVFEGHPEFEGRAHQVKSFYDDALVDGNGHGTHVAGTIGSKTYGVAKHTTIYGVKVLDDGGSGNYSTVIAGMEWVASDMKSRDCPRGVVAGMSLGGAYSDLVNNAAAELAGAGVFLAVAAGNSNVDANLTSPASEATACTVAASTNEDSRAPFSNFGKPVKVFAPGLNITSTWNDGGIKSISGTSMATPHIVGLGAYLASLGTPCGPTLCQKIQKLATTNALSDVPEGTVNLLANNGFPL